jgi:hypothetical protein
LVDHYADNHGRVRTVVERFIAWLDRFGEVSQDAHDFWAFDLGRRAKGLYYRHRIAGSLAAAPLIILDTALPSARSLVRKPARFPIGDAHYALGFHAWADVTGDSRWAARAEHFLAELEASRCHGYGEWCWGYPFDWQTTVGLFEAGRPLLTTIPYCYEAFEAGYEASDQGGYLVIMESAARFVHERIPAPEVRPGVRASAYTPLDERRVVNASAYRGALLLSAGKRFEQEGWIADAKACIAFVLDSQREDGSWLYALDRFDAFVDNFHTCFVLKNLFKAWALTGDDDMKEALDRGYRYYRDELLDEKGQPRPFARTQRLVLHRHDLYDYAEGIYLAQLLRGAIPEAEAVLERLVEGLLDGWTLPDGHFVTRKLVVGENRVPYHRWAQAQTFHALACYCRGEG